MKKIHRFFVNADLAGAQADVRDGNIVHQMFHVLRLEPGEEIALLDGRGTEAICRITDISKKGVVCDVVSRSYPDREPKRRVTLYCAILKRENFEWAVQKAVETGVSEIVPIVTRRTVKSEIKPERVQAIMREAAEQCGRTSIPALGGQKRFEECLPILKEAALSRKAVNIFFDTGETMFDALRDRFTGEVDINLFIGPEGGWDADERVAAEDAGMSVTSLGPLVLRAETAVAVAVYLAAHG